MIATKHSKPYSQLVKVLNQFLTTKVSSDVSPWV